MSGPAMQARSRIPRIAEAAVERARLSVVPRRRTAAGRAPFLALVTMVLLGGVIGLLLFNTSMQQASFAATALEQRADRLAARQQGLEMEVERLRNPQRIATEAAALGMVQACSPAFLRLGSGTVTGEPCPGSGNLPLEGRGPTKPAILDPKPRVVTVTAGPERATATDRNSTADTSRGSREGSGRDGKKRNGG